MHGSPWLSGGLTQRANLHNVRKENWIIPYKKWSSTPTGNVSLWFWCLRFQSSLVLWCQTFLPPGAKPAGEGGSSFISSDVCRIFVSCCGSSYYAFFFGCFIPCFGACGLFDRRTVVQLNGNQLGLHSYNRHIFVHPTCVPLQLVNKHSSLDEIGAFPTCFFRSPNPFLTFIQISTVSICSSLN